MLDINQCILESLFKTISLSTMRLNNHRSSMPMCSVAPTLLIVFVFVLNNCSVIDMCSFFSLMQVLSNQNNSTMNTIIDQRMECRFTAEGMESYILLLIRCLDPSSERRPAMSYVEMELDRIIEKEMNLTTMMGERTPTVTLGSQLFKSNK